MGYIGVCGGGWWGRKYWVCGHNHRSGEEAFACARTMLSSGMWDGIRR